MLLFRNSSKSLYDFTSTRKNNRKDIHTRFTTVPYLAKCAGQKSSWPGNYIDGAIGSVMENLCRFSGHVRRRLYRLKSETGKRVLFLLSNLIFNSVN